MTDPRAPGWDLPAGEPIIAECNLYGHVFWFPYDPDAALPPCPACGIGEPGVN